MRVRAFLITLTIVAATVVGAAGWSALRTTVPPHQERSESSATHEAPPGTVPPSASPEIAMLASYLHNIQVEQVGDYIAAIELADYLASLPKPVAPIVSAPAPTQSAPSASGDCYSGTQVPAWIVTRESGGDPNAVNASSGAFGCFQELPSHFAAGGTCAGLNMYDINDQKTCANRLPLSAWDE